MRKTWIIAIVLGVLVLSLAGVYAYSTFDSEDGDVMDIMHEYMVQQIDDPGVQAEMNEMHEYCETLM